MRREVLFQMYVSLVLQFMIQKLAELLSTMVQQTAM